MKTYNFAKYLKSTNGICFNSEKSFGFECTKDSCPFWDAKCNCNSVELLRVVEIYIEKTEINTLLSLI